MSNISGIVKSIQDIMRKDVGVDGDAQRISQLVWMLFLKILDDREDELELLEEDYKSPLPEHLRWRSWAKDPEGKTGEELADFINLQLFPTLKNKLNTVGPNGRRALVVRDVFEDAYNYMKSGTLMRQVVNKICEIDFNTQKDRHTFGNIYEQILKDLQSAGNAGEFYTPRAVTRFIVNRVDPKLDEIVLDPACGTGGFLTCAIDHKREHYVKTGADEETLQGSIYGVDKKTLPHMLCVTNMILHGIDTPNNIKHDNTLSRPLRDYSNKDRVNVIITNPPFGGMEEDGIENNFPAAFRTRETADLFLILIIHLLKDGGRAAVVLPDGFLFGEGMETRLKKKLTDECNLHTIVRLPNGVFSPYTGIKTNLLFFTKGKKTKNIWYYEHPYPDGAKSYSKKKPMQFEEFEAEIDWWGEESDGFAARVENEYAWKVSIDAIKSRNYNLDIKNPHVKEKISHNPEELLQRYARQQRDISQQRDQLKSILAAALHGGSDGLERVNAVTEHFDIWTTAQSAGANMRGNVFADSNSYGIGKLRELILGLALRGLLEGKNEPLPETIERTIYSAKLKYFNIIGKKPKEYTFGPALLDEFSLPKGWKWKRVGELCDLQTGATPSRQKPEYYNGDILWLVSGDINQGVIEDCEGRITEKGLASSNCKILPPKTVLIALNGQGKTRAMVALLNVPAACNQSLVGMIPFDFSILDSKFLLLSLRYRYYEIRDITGQKQRRGLNMGLVSELSIPLPTIAEQHRIVAKVAQLMALCDTLNTGLSEMQYTQIQLADAILEQGLP